MDYEFRWNRDNVEHIGEHGIAPSGAEYVVRHPGAGYPQRLGDGKFLAVGQTTDGAYIQVIYVFDPTPIVYVIHSRPLTENEMRRFRRRRRRRGS